MRLLLDTHVVLWWTGQLGKVSPTVRGLIRDPGNEVLVSAGTAWEMAIKARSGKLQVSAGLLDDFDGQLAALGWHALPILPAHGILAARLPGDHKDPFDRLLVAQGMIEGLTIASIDTQVSALGAQVIW